MSARRERRPPSGRVLNNPNNPNRVEYSDNINTNNKPRPSSALPLRTASPRPTTAGPSVAIPRPQSSYGLPKSGNSSSGATDMNRQSKSVPFMDSGRSAGSELSVNEVLRRIKEKSEREKKAQDDKEIDLMGPYNAFSRPKSSSVVPLRTVLLDPEVNNFPRSRTRTELLKRIRAAYMPHPSYDLDADGYVSTDDYKMAKRFDLDGNGVLDSDEREIGKRVLAEEFFKRHEKDKHNFGAQIAARTHKENVEKLVTSYSFERAYGKLMQVERTLNAESSKPMIACMSDVDDPLFNATKYYCDKFDTSAWNDMNRIPRSFLEQSMGSMPQSSPFQTAQASSSGLFSSMGSQSASVHQGSRKRLMFARKEAQRQEFTQHMQSSPLKSTYSSANFHTRSFGRVNLISDIRTENT
eukprot:gene28645-34583_t